MIFVGLFVFVLLIVVHEFGHFIAARRSGVEVEEFGLGFPPRLFGRKFKGSKTLYTVNLIPLGGFVRLKGENDADKRKGSFGAARLVTKAKIILAGVAMNFLAAAAILTVLALFGLPKLLPGQFSHSADAHIVRQGVRAAIIDEGSPAEHVGLQKGDVIKRFAGQDIATSEQLVELTKQQAGLATELTYQRRDETKTVEVRLRPASEGDSRLGVGPIDEEVTRYTYSAPVVGAATTAQFSWLTLKALGGLLMDLVTADFGQAADQVSGPVGIFAVMNNIDVFGWSYLFALLAIVSLTLAVMNALPIPALDGGRLAITAIFRALRKPLTPRLEERIHGTGFAILLFLILLISVVDVRRFFG